MPVMFADQVAAELAANNDAANKRSDSIQKARVAGNVSDTAAGNRMIQPEVVGFAAELAAKGAYSSLLTGKGAQHLRADVRNALKQFAIEPRVEASIENEKKKAEYVAQRVAVSANLIEQAMGIIVDAVCAFGKRTAFVEIDGDDVPVHKAQDAAQIIDKIGQAIEFELRLIDAKDKAPQLFYRASNYLKDRVFGDAYAAIAAEACLRGLDARDEIGKWAANKAAYVMAEPTADAHHWLAWTVDERLRIGNFFYQKIDAALEGRDRLWDVVLHQVGSGKNAERHNYFVLTDLGYQLFHEAVVDVSFSARDKGVMHTPPIAWMDGVYGGYASNQTTKLDQFIRRGQEGAKPGDMAYAAINNVQKHGYVLNDFILNAAVQLKDAMQKGSSVVGSFMPKVKGMNRAQLRKAMRTEFVLAKALKQSVDENQVFYVPWNVDYRGRMYPIASALHVQGTDFEKSLIKVADAQPVNDRTAFWLAIHIANAAGKDKLTLDQRVAWVKDHEDYLLQIVEQPVEWLLSIADGSISSELAVDEPWQFLSGALEYVMCVIKREWEFTNLLVAVDASCSGIQILSGITHDSNAARMVNVTPSAVKQDAYGEVAARAVEILSDELHNAIDEMGFDESVLAVLDRKVAKKVVMTLAYNASALSNGEDIKEALADIKFEPGVNRKAVISWFGKAIRRAVDELLPGVSTFKDWMNASAEAYASAAGSISWTTPSGFKVVQIKNVAETVTLHTAFMGKKGKVTLKVCDTDVVSPRAHATATMPNFVHSLDASVLHMAFADFAKPFSLIHDSVMTTASDMDAAIDAYKRAYVAHFSGTKCLDDLKQMFAPYADRVKAAAPVAGDLKVSDVLHSQFFLA
jgi:hypothetical protein